MEDNIANSVRVARVGRPHGIRGEVTVEVFTDSPERRFTAGNVLSVRSPQNNLPIFETLTVENARWNKQILLLKFTEFSDRNTAESLRNVELYAPADGQGNAEGAGWYAQDLIGLEVHEGSLDSTTIGEVTNLITGDAQDLIEVQLIDGTKTLLPFVEEIVPVIDEEHGAVVITPPPGLLELNQD